MTAADPTCSLCGQPVTPGTDSQRIQTVGFTAHRTCLLRNVLGGIGHLENHRRWCIEAGDPDGGRTYYQSGLEVEDWINQHGYPPRPTTPDPATTSRRAP